jgi:hypothetical protein
MKKQLNKKQRLLPIVLISFQDHSADLEGIAAPYHFTAIGVVLKETPEGYVLGHWLQSSPAKPFEDMGEVTTYIAKVKGMKIKTINHLVVE